MKKVAFGFGVAAACMATSALAAGGSEAEKPQGFRFFNQHLTVKPYVAV